MWLHKDIYRVSIDLSQLSTYSLAFSRLLEVCVLQMIFDIPAADQAPRCNNEETTGFKLGVDMAGRGCSVTCPLLKPSSPHQTV